MIWIVCGKVALSVSSSDALLDLLLAGCNLILLLKLGIGSLSIVTI